MLSQQAILAFAFLGALPIAHAQFETVLLPPAHASRLAGVIVDPAGGQVDDALVERFDCSAGRTGERNVLQAVKTDAHGNFNMRPTEKRDSYCLRITRSGFDNLEVQVIIRRFSHDLRLTLPIAA